MKYTVKDWFLNKIANELHRTITSFGIFAILKEADKAVYAMCSISADKSKTMWIPKSVLEETNLGQAVRYIEDYNEALKEFHAMWSLYM